MERSSSPTQHVRPLGNAAGMSAETIALATEMTRIAARSPDMTGRLPTAIAAGCLYTAALAVGSGRNGSLQADQSFPSSENAVPRTSRKSESGLKRNTQIARHRTDRGSTEVSICEFASITPASLRRYAREVAAIYLDSDADADSRTRQRLSRLALR